MPTRLTSRERLLRLFGGKDIDRVPIWLLFPWHRLGCYADVYNNLDYAAIVERIKRGDCDSLDRRNTDNGFCYNANPDIKHHTAGGVTTLTAPGLTFTRGVINEDGRKRVKFYVEDPADLLAILSIPYVPPVPDVDTLRREREEFGDRGLFMMDLGDPLGPLYNLMAAGDFAMATATDYDILETFLQEMEGRVLSLYRACLEADVADCYFIVGCEFAGPPLVSPERFRQMSARYVRGICDLIRSYGKISILHYHGNLLRVREGVREINPDALHTIEAPPIGDCTLTQAREILTDTALIGNLQYDDLVRLPTDEIESSVKAIHEEAKGRFILSPTAGPYEDTLSTHAQENYLRFIDAGLKYGKK